MNAPSGPILRDIHLPPPPGWWPPAPGWWMVAAMAIGLGIFALYKLHKLRKRRRHERAVLRELDVCIEANRHDSAGLAAALSHFLRRLSLRDAHAAAFAGERWLEYLDARGGGEDFRHGIGRVLIDAPFRARADYDTDGLVALVRRFTRNALAAGAAHA
ncbi:MAG: DUF4381 domain-containing protein [Proteobacteria bacterium]|nr:DUF4381 domain-containing protein [Pseudomonadota bacterium]